MAKRKHTGLSFEIDKLTRSIEHVVTGHSAPTVVVPLTEADLSQVTKKNGWRFNWKQELRVRERSVYKLTIVWEPMVIQGLVSLEIRPDHVYMHLVENAPFNLGRKKVYAGVLGNLVAFGCKLAFESGHEGNLAFDSKTALMQHYHETLGAEHVGGLRMVIDTPAALKLLNKYYPA